MRDEMVGIDGPLRKHEDKFLREAAEFHAMWPKSVEDYSAGLKVAKERWRQKYGVNYHS